MTFIANDYNSIKEILSKEEFDGRLSNGHLILERAFGEEFGIFFTDGPLWKEQRRFALRHMRDVGFGRRHEKFEASMMEEISLLINMLKEGPINDQEKAYLRNGFARFPDVLYPYVGNNIWCIMFGERFDRSEHYKLKYFCESAMEFQRSGDTSGGAISAFWFLKYFGNMFGYTGTIKSNLQLINFIKEHLDSRKYSSDGLVDQYLKEMNKKANLKSNFTEKQLIMTLVDFMFPAISALPSAVVHAIKAVMHHPKVLKNVQEEIDRVVGTGRLVTWDDRKSLPYTEATIRESLRYETLTPLSAFHKALKPATLCGYNVEKDTPVVTNLAALHSDVNMWGDPENFRPERFLNEDGQLGKDCTLPFGFGHRVCAGETFARYNLFELLAVLVQNFNFSFVEGEPTGLDDKLPGIVVTPKETWIRVQPRYTSVFNADEKMSPFLIFILLFLIGYKIYEFLTSVPPNVPPCLPRLPLVGCYWHLLWHNYNVPIEAVYYYVNKLRSKIITCYLGSAMTIFVTDYNAIKEVLLKEEFDGRTSDVGFLLDRAFGKKLGIFFNEGKFAQEHKRFILRNMRDFGFGRRHEKYEANMMEEISILIQMLKEGPINDNEKTYLKDGLVRFPDILFPYTTNSIWEIIFGKRFDRSEFHKLNHLCTSAIEFQRSGNPVGGAIAYFWYLKYFGNVFKYKDFIDSNRNMVEFIKEHIDKNRCSGQDEDRGVLDRYLKEIKKNENVNFTEQQLIITIVDIVFPSVSILLNSMFFAIKLVMHHPEVMRKVQEEIDRVVGTGRLVTWDDRKSLPYVEATLREVFRYDTLAPTTVLHKALKDTAIDGYNVPKDTVVILSLKSINMDPELWEEPEKFRPERFLNDDGQLIKDLTLPFGMGRRMCVAETFSRYHMFEVFATLLQNFNFSFVKGEPTGLEDKVPGLVITHKDTWVRVEQRHD
ncbi:farnesoate epoxidase-like [Xylocopa sonorina]|uniref:farnesoate epoxidase-like n=1 Tax=Xylocopa sonorina TaxID=1818115 RepID=UPI00403B2EF7